MCTGLEILAAVSTAASAAGTGFSFISGMQQASAAKSAAEYNASMMEREALDATERAEEERGIYKRDSARQRAEVEARMVGNGIDISGGSAGSLLSDYAEIEEIDAQRITESGRRETQYKLDQAAITRSGGANAALAGQYGAAGSLLSGASMVADRWSRRPPTPRARAGGGK